MKRVHFEPFPTSDVVTGVLQFVRRMLAAPKVQRIEISTKGTLVEREMEDAEEPVVPEGSNDVDVAYLVNHTNLIALPFDPKQHPLYALYDAGRQIEDQGREVMTLVVPGWPLFAAWLGVQEAPQPKTVFGMKLTVVPSHITNERVVVLGAKPMSLFLSDVDVGVTIDLGV